MRPRKKYEDNYGKGIKEDKLKLDTSIDENMESDGSEDSLCLKLEVCLMSNRNTSDNEHPREKYGDSGENNQSTQDESEKESIFRWKGSRFGCITKESREIVQFLFADVVFLDFCEDELAAASLEWKDAALFLVYPNGENEEIQGIKINGKESRLSIVCDVQYNGPVTQILELVNGDKKIESPIITDIFNFLQDYIFNLQKEIIGGHDDDSRKRPSEIEIIDNTDVKKKKPDMKTSTQIEHEAMESLIHRLKNQESELPRHEIKVISLDVLEKDETIRGISDENVIALFNQMVTGQWKNDLTSFVVYKAENSDKFKIINGNHRFEAMKKFNSTVALHLQHLNVKCEVYGELDLDQILLITAPTHEKLPHVSLTIWQQLKLVRKVVDNHLIRIPTSKKEEDDFNQVMKVFFKDYPVVINQLIRLPESLLNAISEISYNGISIEYDIFTSSFWKAFISAAKKNDEEALNILKSLDIKSKKVIEKELKNVEVNLLLYLAERGDHSFLNEQEAINYFMDGNQLDKSVLLKSLSAIGFNHNRRRTYHSCKWASVKEKLQNYWKTAAVYNNAKFVNNIDEDILSISNLIVTQNPTKTFLTALEKFQNDSVLMIFGNFGAEVPKLENSEPTVILDVIVEHPVIIDKVSETLPVTSVKLALYIPNTPIAEEKEKIKYLNGLCQEKNCMIASSMVIDHVVGLSKLALNYDNALICHTNENIAKSFLTALSYYKIINVAGSQHLKDLVATTSKEFGATNEADDVENFEDK